MRGAYPTTPLFREAPLSSEVLVDLSFDGVLHHHEDPCAIVKPPVEPNYVGVSKLSVLPRGPFDSSVPP